MPRLTPQHYRVLIKIFEKAGFTVKRTRGSHFVMNKPGVERPIVIPKYEEVDVDIIKANLKTAQLSREALKKMVSELRRLRIHRRVDMSVEQIAEMLNPKLRGWIYYYGKFRRVCLKHFLHRLNVRLLKWIRNKYKSLRYRVRAAESWLKNVYKNNPGLFGHWHFGFRP